MKAIQTKFFGMTDKKPARIQAKSGAGTKYFQWNYELGDEENHRAAAINYAKSVFEMRVGTKLATGYLGNGVWAHCFCDDYAGTIHKILPVHSASRDGNGNSRFVVHFSKLGLTSYDTINDVSLTRYRTKHYPDGYYLFTSTKAELQSDLEHWQKNNYALDFDAIKLVD